MGPVKVTLTRVETKVTFSIRDLAGSVGSTVYPAVEKVLLNGSPSGYAAFIEPGPMVMAPGNTTYDVFRRDRQQQRDLPRAAGS